MRVATKLALGSLALTIALAPAVAQEDRVPTFNEAVDALVAQVRAVAPERLHIELNEATPEELGWRASREGTPARVLVVMHPNGAARVFGLLPGRGTYTPLPEGRGVVAIGPGLVVVDAAQQLQVALTLQELEVARPALERAVAPIRAWEQEAPGDVDTSFVKGGVRHATKRPYCVEVDVAPGGQVDLAAAWKAGHTAVVYRVLREDGAFVAPTVALAPR